MSIWFNLPGGKWLALFSIGAAAVAVDLFLTQTNSIGKYSKCPPIKFNFSMKEEYLEILGVEGEKKDIL